MRLRRSEILSLADELLTRYSTQFERPKPVLCQESIQHLMEHSWPGNLPELQTALKTFVAIGDQADLAGRYQSGNRFRQSQRKSQASITEGGHASLLLSD